MPRIIRQRSKSLPTFFLPAPFPQEIAGPEIESEPEIDDYSSSDFELGSDEEIEDKLFCKCHGSRKSLR